MEPNKEAITKWVEALESDEFQGRQMVNDLSTPKGRKMCALGVRDYVYLREVENLTGFVTKKQIYAAHALATRWTGVDDVTLIGETEDGRPFGVVCANDKHRMTFPEIAQHLRKRFL